jgi:hypothetical protein
MALSAIPPNHPHRYLALDAARNCLSEGVRIMETHRDANNDYAWAVYCHWMLMRSPVTPFMSVFGHIIAYPLSSAQDIELLRNFTSSLQTGTHVSDGIDKFYKLCSIFVQVAQAYVQAKSMGNSPEGDVKAGEDPASRAVVVGEFDESLASLGIFLPQDATVVPSGDVPPGLQQQDFNLLSPGFIDYYMTPMSQNELLERDLGAFDSFSFSP